MSQPLQSTRYSRRAAWGLLVAVCAFFAANPAHAQWAAKPPPPLPRTVLDQAWTGSVVLALIFDGNGRVKDVRVLRTSGIPGLDEVAIRGAMRWRLDPAALRPSDMTVGRQHLVKFFQDKRVSRRVEPYQAFWKEL